MKINKKHPWNKGLKGVQVSYRKGKTWKDIWGEEKATKMKMNLRHKKWKGIPQLNKEGYLRIRDRNTGKEVLYHHHVWKNNHKKEIPKGYLIHHIDKNILNNNINNLQLMSFKEHTRMHHTGLKHSMKSRKKMSISQRIRRSGGKL